MTKSEYLQIKIKLKILRSSVMNFEAGLPPFNKENLYAKWKAYERLPYSERVALEESWKQYYRDVEAGFYAQKRQEASRLMKTGQTKALSDLVAVVKSRPEPDVPQPKGGDPEELRRKMGDYITAKSRIEKYESLIEDWAELYESKKKSSDFSL